ncbi:MAG: 2-oxo-4-hydroxy-4-carboxy-5-ureidoimidazoline decarboxylase [Gammaproteobacteria bacterium]|nr:2-oxo-4-hydroxy-4-carboxy-5-ureidoimidazoline decarboxylase [Gammaproteobacteria bacterium]
MGISIDEINHSSAARFVELLGGIFELSPWVPELVYPDRPFESGTELHRAMAAAVRRAPQVHRMQLLCSHPELAGREAGEGTLTDESKREQAGAGLNQCSAEELAKIESLNRAYHSKFGFPFIIAVTGLNKHQIIASMENRLDNPEQLEFDTAIDEVEKIARIRIDALIDE